MRETLLHALENPPFSFVAERYPIRVRVIEVLKMVSECVRAGRDAREELIALDRRNVQSLKTRYIDWMRSKKRLPAVIFGTLGMLGRANKSCLWVQSL